MKKQLLYIGFAFGVGYIFVELERFLSGVQLKTVEWGAMVLLFIGVILLWRAGQQMELEDRQKRIEEMAEAIKKVLHDEGVKFVQK